MSIENLPQKRPSVLEGEIIAAGAEDPRLERKLLAEVPKIVSDWFLNMNRDGRRMIYSDETLLRMEPQELVQIYLDAHPGEEVDYHFIKYGKLPTDENPSVTPQEQDPA